MARFLVWSDLHNEHGTLPIPDPRAAPWPLDGILIAGDIDTGLQHVDFMADVSRKFALPVVAVRGNHEYYGAEIYQFEVEEAARIAQARDTGADITMLDGTSVDIAGVRIVGATLWTDFALDPVMTPFAMRRSLEVMPDYRAIKIDDGGIRVITPDDLLCMHKVQKKAIFDILEKPHEKTIVMTHHVPTPDTISARYQPQHLTNASFVSDLRVDISRVDLAAWICGHIHEFKPAEIDTASGPRSLVLNPRGYPFEHNYFDPFFVLQV